MAELPDGAGKSFDIDEELNSSTQAVLEVYSEIKDTLSQSIKEMESSQSTSGQFLMTSTPKSKDMDNFSHLRPVTDRRYIPFPIKENISDPEQIGRLCVSRANEECDERHHNSSSKSSKVSFMASLKHFGSETSSELFSLECSTLPIKDDEQSKSSLNYTSYHISESQDPSVSFEGHDDQLFKDQTLSLSDLKGKHSDTEEIESGLLEITDNALYLSDGSMSAPVTNVSQLTDHSVDVTEAEVPPLHHSNVLLHTRGAWISENSVDSPCWNIHHFRYGIPTTVCHECAASKEKVVHKINTLTNNNWDLQKQFKDVDDRDIAKMKEGGCVFRIQELESYLTESDQLHMQEQRLKSKTAGVQMALKHLRINEQCLKDENLRCKEEISRLKTENSFLQLRLSTAEQDGEEYVHEIRTITDKCDDLLNQRKRLQDERNHLSVEKQFLIKEIEDFKRENKRNSEQLSLITTEKEKLVKMLNSTKTMLFTYAKEKQELQSRLKEALAENSDLKRNINDNKTEQQRMDESNESWSNEVSSDRNEPSTLEIRDLLPRTKKL